MDKIIILLIVLLSSFVWPISSQFKDSWYDGKAEISTYSISEMRYGEFRKGTRVMIFVTEPLRLSSFIKPDYVVSDIEKIEVIKLNDIRKFNTGIYDYSIMTSVFSAVEAKPGIPTSSIVKIAFTTQEWCGNVFEILQRKGDHLYGNLFSYFESEGNSNYKIRLTNRVETEDNLWLLIRELQGEEYEPGKSYPLDIIPSSWSRRKAHTKVATIPGKLKKELAEELKTAIGIFPSNKFIWEYAGKRTEVWVEQTYPHRILAWKEPDGSFGSLLASRRETYWKQNKNIHAHLRQSLKLFETLP